MVMLLHKEDFTIGRCQNSAWFSGNIPFRVTKKIEGKEDGDTCGKQE